MKRPVIALLCCLSAAGADDEPLQAVVELVAPGPPAVESNPDAKPAPRPRTTLWSIGEPTDQEQLYLELINRARDNPGAEGIRLAAHTDPGILQAYGIFGVDLNLMKTEMAAVARAWPLAMNGKLIASARAHSNWMFSTGLQQHDEPNGRTILARAAEQGYSASNIGENIYIASKSTEYGHAGFEVDWGAGSGGMQAGRGHRVILHAGYREVGIGIKNGTNGSNIGPQVVTQDYAIPSGGSSTPFVTGVAYYDYNGNNFYDPGEGLGGLQVTVSGASYHGLTAASGGYAVPVPSGAATRTVTFSGNGFNYSTTAQIKASNWSVKVDFRPAYIPPVLNGVATPVTSAPNQYSVGAVAGASAHEWRYMRRIPAVTDGANDLTRISSSMTSARSTQFKSEGTASYWLNHASGRDEYFVYRDARVAGAAPVLRYYSRLALAQPTQKAYVQVSTDNGATWTTLETQSGTGTSGQGSFSQRTVSLASVAGKEFLLRFYYAITGNPFNTTSSGAIGWYIDSVSFTDVLDATGAVSAGVPAGNTVAFTPPASGEWLLSARPTIYGRTLGYGPPLSVTAVTAPPPPTFSNWAVQQEASAGLPAGSIALTGTADYNKDGVSNLVAYALGLSPVQPAGHLLPRPVKQGTSLVLDYSREASRTDVTVTPEVSSDFRTWYSLGAREAPPGFTDTLMGTAGTVQSRRVQLPIDPALCWSIRLKVTRP